MTQEGIVTYKIIGGDHKEYGPATAEELRHWILDGRVSGLTLVQLVGSGEWKSLSTFAEFSEDLNAQALRFGNALMPAGAAPASSTTPALVVPGTAPALRIGHCLAGSARLFSANFGLIAGACMLTWLLSMACQFVPLIGGILYWFLQGALYGGLYLVFLKRIRGEPASMADALGGFGPQFMQLSLAGLLITLLTTLGFFACFIPWLYLTVAWAFTIPAVADKRLEFWSAMELSRRVATQVWFKLAMLLLLAFLPLVLMQLYTQLKVSWTAYPLFEEVFHGGQFDMKKFQDVMAQVLKVSWPLLVISKVVLLFNLPFAIGAVAYAYEDLFGAGASRKD
jgi:hypothetical protein